MLGKLFWVFPAIFVFSSVHSLTVVDRCCGPELASLVHAELFDLHSRFCGPLVGNETLLEDIKLIQDEVVEMFNNGRLNLRGQVGDTGLPGPPGNTGRFGHPGLPGRLGRLGDTGPTGGTGSTGPRGYTGAKGKSGYLWRNKRQDGAGSSICKSVRDKIIPLLAGCTEETRNYFLKYADEIQKRCSGISKSPTENEKEFFKEFISRYEQVLNLFNEVKSTYDRIKNEVKTNPRYKGATGFPGKTGFTGGTGAIGMPGLQGAAGSTGPRGAHGLTGARGGTGDTGPTGGSGSTFGTADMGLRK